MFDFSFLIPGTDIKVSLLDYDIESETASFLLSDENTSIKKGPLKLKLNENLNLVDDYFFYPIELKNKFIVFAVGKKTDTFTFRSEDENILGYANANFNDMVPKYLIFQDDKIKIKTEEKTQLANTDFYLGYGENRKIKLFYLDQLTGLIEPFNPKESVGKFIVFDELSEVRWEKGALYDGIMFDASGDGIPDDWPIYNDLFITEVREDFVIFQPAMIVKPNKGEAFELKGQHYLTISVDLGSKQMVLNPVSVIPLIENSIYFEDALVLLDSDRHDIVINVISQFGKTHDERVVPYLVRSLLVDDFAERIEAAHALSNISKTRRNYGVVKKEIFNLFDTFPEQSDPTIVINLLNALMSNAELSKIVREKIIKDLSDHGEIAQDFASVERMETEDKLIDKCPKYGYKCARSAEISKKYNKTNVFVAIPYARYRQYEKIIRDALVSSGLNPIVSKDSPSSMDIFCKVCFQIQISEYGIVDISRGLRNIDFELGLLHGRGKQTAILQRKNLKPEKFSDIHGIELQQYMDKNEFKKRLEKWIKSNIKS